MVVKKETKPSAKEAAVEKKAAELKSNLIVELTKAGYKPVAKSGPLYKFAKPLKDLSAGTSHVIIVYRNVAGKYNPVDQYCERVVTAKPAEAKKEQAPQA